MRQVTWLRGLTAVLAVGLLADGASAAIKRAQGGSGYSGKLASSPAVRQQQLICDPEFPESGTTSVIYDPAIVSLSSPFESPEPPAEDPSFFGVVPGPGYRITTILVEVDDGEGGTFLDFFFAGDGYTPGDPLPLEGRETGFLQVGFVRDPTATDDPGEIDPRQYGDFTTVDVDDVFQGVDTHAIFFHYNVNAPDFVDATYTIFADTGTRGNNADFLRFLDGTEETTLGPGDLRAAQVRGGLVPEPSALALFGLGGLLALRRRRAR